MSEIPVWIKGTRYEEVNRPPLGRICACIRDLDYTKALWVPLQQPAFSPPSDIVGGGLIGGAYVFRPHSM